MDCISAREELGPYLDGELSAERVAALETHLRTCPPCAVERSRLQNLVAQIQSSSPQVPAPAPDLWDRIEARLETRRRQSPFTRLLHRPLAMAASLAILLGAGASVAFWLNQSAQVAQADTVDYRILLDGVAKDADAAVDRFLKHYQAIPMDAGAITTQSSPLHFAIPQMLPGEYRLQDSYQIRIGRREAYAARYRRDSDGDMVFTCFHRPMNKTLLGVHRESHCALAKGSHAVEAGPWQLIHFTDPTTCHCLLSRETSEPLLREMLAAISPQLAASSPTETAH